MAKIYHSRFMLYSYLDNLKDKPEYKKACRAKARGIVEAEARKLMRMIQERIDDYYRSYEPVKYIRTYQLKHALRIGTPRFDGKTISIVIYFDKSMATKNSVMGGSQANAADLIDGGWTWHKVPPGGHIERFTRFEGEQFLQDAIAEYKAQCKYQVHIQIIRKPY